jgi:DNA replication protein DnaC
LTKNAQAVDLTVASGNGSRFWTKTAIYRPIAHCADEDTRAQALFRDLAIARADGSLRLLLAKLSRIDVLVIDDWAMAPLCEPMRRDFWEICEDRYQERSTILTSQFPVSRWHEQIGDPTLADGILDRLVHNAHRIDMRGDSMRKNRGKPNA